MRSPPRAAERLLALVLGRGARTDALVGDLQEAYGAELGRTGSSWRAAFWYWREAMRLASRFTLAAVLRAASERRPREKRRQRGDAMVAGFMREMTLAVRGLVRVPAYSVIAILTLGLGIGSSTAIYSLLEVVLFEALPWPDADRLVRLKNLVPGVDAGTEWQLSPAQYFYYSSEVPAIEKLGGYRWTGSNVELPGTAERARVAEVTASTFELLGARPAAGRLMVEAEYSPGSAAVVVLSHGFWRSRFGGSPGVLGQTIRLNGMEHEVIGVTAAGLRLPSEPGSAESPEPDLWLPHRLNPAGPFYNNHYIPAVARLRAGVTVEQLNAELEHVIPRLTEVFPRAYAPEFITRYGFRSVAYELKPYMMGDVARNLWVLFGAVGLVLLIACANVANLFLARIEGRRRELAVRSALGAGRAGLGRLLLAESVALALCGGLLGLPLALAGVRGAVALAPDSLPVIAVPGIDGTVLLFAFGVSLLVASTIAILPLSRFARVRGSASLIEGGRSVTAGRDRQRVRSALVVVQVALALVLLVGAALLVESFRRLRAVDPGIDSNGVLTASLFLPGTPYSDREAMWRFYSQVLERVRALPGVSAAGMSSEVPFTGAFGCTVQGFEDTRIYDRLRDAGMTTCAGQEPTTPGYFEAMGIPLLQGRTFTAADNDQPANGAVIVSRAFADRFWPGEDPIGKGVSPSGRTAGPFYRVVGVVGDVYSTSVTDESPGLAIYYPVVAIPGSEGLEPRAMNLVVRTGARDPMSILAAVRRAVAEVDPAIPLANPEPMARIVARSMSRLTFTMALIGVAAAVALALAAIGLFGVISYIVTRRTNEIGVRLALGARAGQVQGMVVRGSLALTAAGLAIGLVVALALTRVLGSLLYGVQATDPLAFLAAALVLALVALAASWIPARRAAALDPLHALRLE